MTLAFFVLIQYRSVTDGRTDGRSSSGYISACIACYANALVKIYRVVFIYYVAHVGMGVHHRGMTHVASLNFHGGGPVIFCKMYCNGQSAMIKELILITLSIPLVYKPSH